MKPPKPWFGTIHRDPAYLKWLRGEPCIISGTRANVSESVVAAHIGTMGTGIKSHDWWALPMLNSTHQRCHNEGEISVLRMEAPDWLIRAAFRAYAKEIYAEYLAEMEKTA